MDAWAKFRRAIEIVQKQAVVLMVAIGDRNEHLAIVACGRIRTALREAERLSNLLAAETPALGVEATAMLHAARETVVPWLARAPKALTLREAYELLNHRGASSLPSIGGRRDEIQDLQLDGVDLSHIDLSGAHLSGIRARDSKWNDSIARYVELDWCVFEASAMASIRFDDATISDCSFSRADLGRSSWGGSRVTRSSFQGCVLVDARLEGATFTECDFRGADLAVVDSTTPDAPVRAAFVRCDLRESNWSRRSVAGICLVDCKLYGTHGAPIHVETVVIERPDLSFEADASAIGTSDDVRARWFSNWIG
jgi:uncharacterized protein YjbI with pentapeptide repeats